MAEAARWQEMQRKVLFVRVGWMRFYNGPGPTDERPVGGGSYNEEDIGHEVYNFREAKGRLYGYFQPSMASRTVNLERIDPTATDKDMLSGVLVVMVARRAEGGQVIVGWYSDAEVFREGVPQSPGKPRGYGHICSAKRKGCVLLPEYNRIFEIPRGMGGMGRANICYPLDVKGKPKASDWMQQAINFIDGYRGSDILGDPEADAERESTDVIEKALARSKGQGFPRNHKERRALELRAMHVATRHFEKDGYTVEDMSARRPYDLLCSKGAKELHVEVKGTMTDGDTIVLTRNEVRHAGDPDHLCVLFILHSILEDGKALGGKSVVIDPWSLCQERLIPISYTYRVG